MSSTDISTEKLVSEIKTKELERLRCCEVELRMLRGTARAWLNYKSIEHLGSSDHYANFVIEEILLGRMPR